MTQMTDRGQIVAPVLRASCAWCEWAATFRYDDLSRATRAAHAHEYTFLGHHVNVWHDHDGGR